MVAKKTKVKQHVPEVKAKHTAALRKLKPVAREVNAMLANAAKAEGRSFDLRLSAACHLAKARETCEQEGIKFKVWCEENVKTSYKEVKRLALVGASDDPKLALEDLRAKTAARVRKSRETAASAPAPSSAGRVTHASAQPPASAYVGALDNVHALPEDEQVKLATEVANGVGMGVVSAASIRGKGEHAAEATDLAAIKLAVGRLEPTERRKLIRWLTEKCEEDAAAAGIEAAGGEAERPGFLDRGTGVKAKRKRAKTKK